MLEHLFDDFEGSINWEEEEDDEDDDVISHGILAGTYLAEYRDSLK